MRRPKQLDLADGALFRAIRCAAGPGTEHRRAAETLAFPERLVPARETRKAWRAGIRAFTLWRDADRREAVAHLVTRHAPGRGHETYEVVDAENRSLALISRAPAGFILRAKWTVLPAGADRPAVGRKGSLALWALWWLLVPYPSPGLLAGMALCFFQCSSPTPRRIDWAVEGRPVLTYADGPAVYELRMPDDVPWDPRVAAALLTLVESRPGWLTRRTPDPAEHRAQCSVSSPDPARVG